MLKRERGGIDDAVAIIGLKRRTIESKSARGEIPGAAKLANRWTYDLDRLRAWVREEVNRQCRENQKRQQAVSGVAIPSTVGLASKGGSSRGAFTQITRDLRQSVERRGRRA